VVYFDLFVRSLGALAVAISLINSLLIWRSQPGRETSKRIDETNEKLEELVSAADARADRHREDLKIHDRRIQKLEDVLPHMPTKDDVHALDQKITKLETHLSSVGHTVNRIDDFLRKHP
jgi:MoxR-like ATPase